MVNKAGNYLTTTVAFLLMLQLLRCLLANKLMMFKDARSLLICALITSCPSLSLAAILMIICLSPFWFISTSCS